MWVFAVLVCCFSAILEGIVQMSTNYYIVHREAWYAYQRAPESAQKHLDLNRVHIGKKTSTTWHIQLWFGADETDNPGYCHVRTTEGLLPKQGVHSIHDWEKVLSSLPEGIRIIDEDSNFYWANEILSSWNGAEIKEAYTEFF